MEFSRWEEEFCTPEGFDGVACAEAMGLLPGTKAYMSISSMDEWSAEIVLAALETGTKSLARSRETISCGCRGERRQGPARTVQVQTAGSVWEVQVPVGATVADVRQAIWTNYETLGHLYADQATCNPRSSAPWILQFTAVDVAIEGPAKRVPPGSHDFRSSFYRNLSHESKIALSPLFCDQLAKQDPYTDNRKLLSSTELRPSVAAAAETLAEALSSRHANRVQHGSPHLAKVMLEAKLKRHVVPMLAKNIESKLVSPFVSYYYLLRSQSDHPVLLHAIGSVAKGDDVGFPMADLELARGVDVTTRRLLAERLQKSWESPDPKSASWGIMGALCMWGCLDGDEACCRNVVVPRLIRACRGCREPDASARLLRWLGRVSHHPEAGEAFKQCLFPWIKSAQPDTLGNDLIRILSAVHRAPGVSDVVATSLADVADYVPVKVLPALVPVWLRAGQVGLTCLRAAAEDGLPRLRRCARSALNQVNGSCGSAGDAMRGERVSVGTDRACQWESGRTTDVGCCEERGTGTVMHLGLRQLLWRSAARAAEC